MNQREAFSVRELNTAQEILDATQGATWQDLSKLIQRCRTLRRKTWSLTGFFDEEKFDLLFDLERSVLEPSRAAKIIYDPFAPKKLKDEAILYIQDWKQEDVEMATEAPVH